MTSAALFIINIIHGIASIISKYCDAISRGEICQAILPSSRGSRSLWVMLGS